MKKLHGYCAVLALTYVSGLSESIVLEVCKEHDFKDNGEGMIDEEWMGAAKDLGIKKRKVRFRGKTVGDFLKAYPTGLYLATTHNHLFAVLNGGIIIHPQQDKTDKRCKLESGWKIIQP